MKESKKKVLDIFFDNPTGKFYIREIARLTRLNPNTVITATKELSKEGFIKREKRKHVVEFSAAINEKFKEIKRIRNLERIYCSGIIEFLVGKFKPEVISVIGSYSGGGDLEESDIDLVVITKKKYEGASLKKYEEILKRKIHLIIADYSGISDEFYTNLINGIVLYGFISKK